MKKIMKGFTLVELMVVMAMISVLAALIIPNAATYIKESQKTVDVQNARMIAEAVDLTLLMRGDQKFGGYDYTVAESFVKHNTTTFNVTEDGESYSITVVAKINGNSHPRGGNAAAFYTWGAGNSEARAFVMALNDAMGFPESSGRPLIKMKYTGPHDNGLISDRYLVCYRSNNSEAIEIWAGDSNGTYGSQPVARLYPEPGDEYKVAK